MLTIKNQLPGTIALLLVLALDPLGLRLLVGCALVVWYYWRWFTRPKTVSERQEKALAHLASALDTLDTQYERDVFMACCEREIGKRSQETNPAN